MSGLDYIALRLTDWYLDKLLKLKTKELWDVWHLTGCLLSSTTFCSHFASAWEMICVMSLWLYKIIFNQPFWKWLTVLFVFLLLVILDLTNHWLVSYSMNVIHSSDQIWHDKHNHNNTACHIVAALARLRLWSIISEYSNLGLVLPL